MDKTRILVVEDEAVTAMDLKNNLLELGYAVIGITPTGREAIRLAQEQLPDLILMDIRLEGPMSGIEAAEEIAKTQRIPIIYLTAHTDTETLDRAKITEPFGYLPKPCSVNSLLTTIEMALYKSAADRARRQAEAEVKRVMHEQKIILENIGVGVLFVINRKILWANQTMSKMFGCSFDEMAGHDTEILYPDRDSYLKIGEEGYARLREGKIYSGQQRMKCKDGSLLWCNLIGQAVNPERLDEGTIWIMEDVSERRQIEDALRQSEEKYRTVANFTYDWEFWIGADGSMRYCSPSCEKITGYVAADFENDPHLMQRIVLPEDQGLYDRHRHGAVNQGVSEEIDFRIVHADGSTRWMAHACRPVYDEQGRYLGTRGSNRDITERKGLESEVVKARNLESLGVLAGGIAHDFNNIFQGLLGNISLAKMCLPENSEAYPFLDGAEKVYAQASKLTGQLLAFSTGGLSIRVNIDPAKHLRDVAAASLNGFGHEVTFDLASDLWAINVDPVQFRQAIKHMVENAIDAMPATGTLRIAASNEAVLAVPGQPTTLAPGNYVKISIQDQGSGISPENLPRIFDPYFSTKPRGSQKGMGLGLPLCDTIIRKHGGLITVETEANRGSTFHIHLPAVNISTEKPPARPGTAGTSPRILIMDDDQVVIQVATQFLKLSGYRIDAAAHGEAAIQAFRQARQGGDPYALVILDLTIPGGMGGKEVVAILKEIDPQVKAIVSSGYVNDQVMTDFRDYGFVGAVEKPYRLHEMKQALDRLL